MSIWDALKQEMSSGFVPGEGDPPKKPGVGHEVRQELGQGYQISPEQRESDVLSRLGAAVREGVSRAWVQEGGRQPGQIEMAFRTELNQGYKDEPRPAGVGRQLVDAARQSAGQEILGTLFNGASQTEVAAARRAAAAERVASRKAMLGGVAKKAGEKLLNKMTGGATGMLNLIRERGGRGGNDVMEEHEDAGDYVQIPQYPAGLDMGRVIRPQTPAGLPRETVEDGVFRVIDGEEG